MCMGVQLELKLAESRGSSCRLHMLLLHNCMHPTDCNTFVGLALKFATYVAIAIHRGLISTIVDYNFTLSSSIVP